MAGKRANGEGSVYQRKDGRWASSLTLERGRRKHFFAKTRQEVSVKLNAALKNRQDGLPSPSEQITVARFLNDWLGTVKASVRPRTYEAYDLDVRRLLPYVGRYRLTRLAPEHVQSCYSALLQGGLSKRSVEQVHTVLHNALRQAVRWGLVVRNVTEAVNVPRPERREMRTLSHAEVQQLFADTADDRLHALWVLLTTSGLRIGEALALRWTDLDFENNRLNVQRAIQRQRGRGLVFVEPKSARSRRVVNLARHATDSLAQHRKRQLAERLVSGSCWEDNDLVFCREDGRPLEHSTVHDRLQRSLLRAKLPRIRIHDLRHTAASLLLARGVHPRVVQELLGHSTITLTLETYSHTTPALHLEAANQMDILFRTG
jgi:integrase